MNAVTIRMASSIYTIQAWIDGLRKKYTLKYNGTVKLIWSILVTKHVNGNVANSLL